MGGGFVAILGDVGSGKTLWLTVLAYEQYKLGRNIYPNYQLDFGDGPIQTVTPGDLQTASNGVACLDELWTWIESRADLGSRDVQTYLTHLLFQSRKNDLDFIGTMQLFRTIDIRFREMVRYIVRPERVRDGFRYKIYNNKDQLLQVRRLTYAKGDNISVTNPEFYYPFYNTAEVVKELDTKLYWKIITDRTTLIPELDGIIQDMLSQSNHKWTQPAIKGYCNAHRLAPHYVPEIYNRLKYLETIGQIRYDT